MKCQNFLCLLLILLLTLPHSLSAQKHNFKKYDLSDGIVQSQISKIGQSRDGTIWISTLTGGLSSYDGRSFNAVTKVNGLISNRINDLQTLDNNVYLAHETGVSIINGVKIRQYVTEPSIKKIAVLSEKEILLVTGEGKLLKLNLANGKTEDVPADSHIVFVKPLFENQILLGTDKGLQDGDNFYSIGHINSIEEINNNMFLIASNEGVFTYDRLTKPKLLDQAFKDMAAFDALIDQDSAIWIATYRGVIKFNDRKLQIIDATKGLTSNKVSDLLIDREGLLWISSLGQGLFKFNRTFPYRIDEETGLQSDIISGILKKANTVVISSLGGGGIDFYNIEGGKVVKQLAPANGLPSNRIRCSFQVGDTLWFGTLLDGIFYIKDKVVKNFDLYEKKPSGNVNVIDRGLNNQIWAGTSDGILQFNGRKWNSIDSFDNEIFDIEVLSQDSVLVGSNHGLYLYVTKQGELSRHRILTDVTIHSILKTDKKIYLGTLQSGLMVLNKTLQLQATFNSNNLLSSDLIYSLTAYKDQLYVGHQFGVDILQYDSEENLAQQPIVESFFSGDEANLNSSCVIDSLGQIWVGTINGVVIFEYKKGSRLQKPALSLGKVSINENSYSDLAAAPSNFRSSNFTFRPNAIAMRASHLIQIDYRMTPIDTGYKRLEHEEVITYNKLPIDNYEFRAKAGYSNSFNTHQSFKFNIQPFFWQHPLFYLVIFLLIASFIYLVARYRGNQKLKQALIRKQVEQQAAAKLRSRMARDFHDEIGNQLASLMMGNSKLQIMLNKITNSKDLKAMVYDNERTIKSAFEGARKLVWSLGIKSNNLEEIFAYLVRQGHKLFDGSTFEFDAELVKNNQIVVVLPEGFNRHILMMFNEGMTNIVKHSKADSVILKLEIDKDFFTLSLTDNGVVALPKEGKGLKNMRWRASEMKFDFVYKNQDGFQILLKGNINSNGSV